MLCCAVLCQGGNVYFDARELSNSTFLWGHGAMLEDERTAPANITFVGNATGWAHHCQVVLGQPECDLGSVEADPLLQQGYAPLPCR